MVKKKIDARVRTLVENGVQLGHRTVFVLVGDRGKDQVSQRGAAGAALAAGRPAGHAEDAALSGRRLGYLLLMCSADGWIDRRLPNALPAPHLFGCQVVNLHYMLSKASVRARPSVLWCYKKELGFTTFVELRGWCPFSVRELTPATPPRPPLPPDTARSA